jgi:hypothetical protein
MEQTHDTSRNMEQKHGAEAWSSLMTQAETWSRSMDAQHGEYV